MDLLIVILAGGLNLSHCPKTKMVDKTGKGWNKVDMWVLDQAKAGCKKHYTKNHCLLEFWKLNKGEDYRAVCTQLRPTSK